ncbi:hypothetical protein GCM10007388_33410 [Pseudoduganella plicata]|uniref:Uncharacterized protein n=2 Tax=Pseudoduganella plicata TaxID=321984 RepID=A0AA87Y549_9BURK|nr:hypothetical protein GCM10007388_33410 [Pseudoduganella plicata]
MPREPGREFITMFEWSQLAEEYVPARTALASARDDQARRLLAGDCIFGAQTAHWPRSRFMFIVRLDEALEQPRATYDLFLRLSAVRPEEAQREAFLALPAIVAAGDFELAGQYMPQPLARLNQLNELAEGEPLLPAPWTAPRLGAELSAFMADVRLAGAILDGLGRPEEAASLRTAALSGIASDELRSLATQECAMPGTIVRTLVEHQMKLEAPRPDATDPASPT